MVSYTELHRAYWESLMRRQCVLGVQQNFDKYNILSVG